MCRRTSAVRICKSWCYIARDITDYQSVIVLRRLVARKIRICLTSGIELPFTYVSCSGISAEEELLDGNHIDRIDIRTLVRIRGGQSASIQTRETEELALRADHVGRVNSGC